MRLRNAFAVGSSPRVRGKPHARGDRTRVRRLIPARAGKIRRASSRGWARRAHPRACGENRHLQHGRVVSHGSSPRVRGKRRTPRSPHPVGGLIPARAGKTAVVCGLAGFRRAHPRACGENTSQSSSTWTVSGSSPRVRGKHEAAAGVVQIPRLIPARAGKTPRFSHPARAVAGSSPRVRGKLRGRPGGRHDDGLIPACAGKTCVAGHAVRRRGAHPRVCGENRFDTDPLADGGSSPRVRGKLGG